MVLPTQVNHNLWGWGLKYQFCFIFLWFDKTFKFCSVFSFLGNTTLDPSLRILLKMVVQALYSTNY